MHNIFFLTTLICFFTGCVSQEAAPVEYKSSTLVESNTKSTLNSNEEEVILKPLPANKEYNSATGYLKEKQPEEPITSPETANNNLKVIYHEVQTGETVDQLAENYHSSKEEIISMNDLVPPFNLEEFQIIKIKVSNDVLNKRNREQVAAVVPNPQTIPYDAINTNYIKPLEGTIITRFGDITNNGRSNGINIEAVEGTSVKSVADGKVVRAGYSAKYGNLVIVKLDDANLFVAYGHLKDLILKIDQKIGKGEVIGHVGNVTNNGGKPQLHLAFKEGERSVDPMKYIAGLNE